MRLPSSLCLVISCLTVHGFVHVVGSEIVTAYSSVFASRRVQRSTRCRFSREPRKLVFDEKFVTSTTNVLPSQCPRESPHHWRIGLGRCGLPFIATLRCHPWPWLVS